MSSRNELNAQQMQQTDYLLITSASSNPSQWELIIQPPEKGFHFQVLKLS